MRSAVLFIVYSAMAVSSTSCHEAAEPDLAPVVERRAPRLGVTQIPPPAGLVTPPSDATKTGSGLIYKKTAVSVNGVQAKRTDTVLVNYTGWRQSTGVTFFTTKARRSPIAINVA